MTACNPVNLSYRFAVAGRSEKGFREGADPSIVRYHGQYWLFASKSGGYWYTHDLSDWTFVPTAALRTEQYGPDATVIDDRLVVTAHEQGIHSTSDHPVYESTDPMADAWTELAIVGPHGDVCYFQDDDGRVYRYDGLSNRTPLYGCEVDRKTMQPLAERTDLYFQDRTVRGWEQPGDDHEGEGAAWVEGSWMTKHDGRYYLQYAAPGTAWNVYSDSVLVSDHPLGPFELQTHNPMSYKPTGFITGAGHGSTFQDEHGNWWHASTMRISVRFMTERRIGLWPAGFDQDGVLFCNTSFGDWPMRTPTAKWDPWRDPFAGWMLLSYRASCSADSALADHPAEHAFDEDVRTWWAAASPEPATLSADFGDECEVNALQINFAEHDVAIHGRGAVDIYHAYVIEGSIDGSRWSELVDRKASREDRPHDYVELSEPVRVRHLRLRIQHVPGGTPAVSGFRVFGRAPGEPPQAPRGVEIARNSADRRQLAVRWQPQTDAIGYQLWWGVAADKLYSSCLVYGRSHHELRCLNSELGYHVAVEAFNRSGRSALSTIAVAR